MTPSPAASPAPLGMPARVEELQRHCDTLEAQLNLLRKASREADLTVIKQSSEQAQAVARDLWIALENSGHYTPAWKSPEELQAFVRALSPGPHSWARGMIDYLRGHSVEHRLEMVREKWDSVRHRALTELNQFIRRPETSRDFPGPNVQAAQWWTWATSLGDSEFGTVYEYCTREHLPSLVELLAEQPRLISAPANQAPSAPVDPAPVSTSAVSGMPSPVNTQPFTPLTSPSGGPVDQAPLGNPKPGFGSAPVSGTPVKAENVREREKSILDRVGIKLPSDTKNGHQN